MPVKSSTRLMIWDTTVNAPAMGAMAYTRLRGDAQQGRKLLAGTDGQRDAAHQHDKDGEQQDQNVGEDHQRPFYRGLHLVLHKQQGHVLAGVEGVRRADKADPDQQVADDLLGKVGGVVEDVAGKYLVDDQCAHRDQNDRRNGGEQRVDAAPHFGHKFDHDFLPFTCSLQ